MAQPGDEGSQPLRSVVLCCTSLAQDARTEIAQVAAQMGAVHKLDLTSDVTHLLVGNVDTPKYRYVAKDRPDIRVLFPGFIAAVRAAWMEGEEVDVAELEKHYTVPPFWGLQVCLTGFDDIGYRKDLERLLVENGATYHGDLTRTVSHLIAAKPEGAKYKHALQWKTHVVSSKWLEDCIKRGMTLDENLYNPQLPEEQQGVGAFRTLRRAASLGKRHREGEESVGVGDESTRRKLRKVASTRLDNQSQDVWRTISQAEVPADKLEQDAWAEEDNSVPKVPSQLPMPKADGNNPVAPESPNGLFSGHHILIHGFVERRDAKLRTILLQNGATIAETCDDLEGASHDANFKARCLLVPHDNIAELPDVPPGTAVVTEWWAERCLDRRERWSSESHILSAPLPNVVVSGFEKLVICSTGFTGVDFRQIAEAVKFVGGTYQEELLQSTSVLLCGSEIVKKEKARYALKHGIELMSPEWLWESLKSRQAANFDDYRIKLPSQILHEFKGHTVDKHASPTPTRPFEVREPSNTSERLNDYAPPKRLSNTRTRHATPSLVLKPSKSQAIETRKSRTGPFILEDTDSGLAVLSNDDIHDPNDGAERRSQQRALRELAPNRSPQRADHASKPLSPKSARPSSEVLSEPTARKSPVVSPVRSSNVSSHDALPLSKTLAAQPTAACIADLASILQRRTSSNSAKAGCETQKRKYRPLGRNLSGSNRSASIALPAERPESLSLVDGFYVSHEEATPEPPSTQLGYDDPEAHAHRMEMSKQLGTKWVEEEARPASAPLIKDSDNVIARSATRAAAGTSRAKARNRNRV